MSNSFGCLGSNLANDLREGDIRECFAAAKIIVTERLKKAAAFVAIHKVGFLSCAIGAGVAAICPGISSANAALAIGAFMQPLMTGSAALQSPEKFADSMTSGVSDVLAVRLIAMAALGLGAFFVLTAGCVETGATPEVHLGMNVTIDHHSAVHGDVALTNATAESATIQAADNSGIEIDNSSVVDSHIHTSGHGEVILRNASLAKDVHITSEGRLVVENTTLHQNVVIDVKKDETLTIKGSEIEGQDDTHWCSGTSPQTTHRGVYMDASGVVESSSLKVEDGGRDITVRNDVHLKDAKVIGWSEVKGPDTEVISSVVDHSEVNPGEHLVRTVRTQAPFKLIP